jgi:hypothetical protein
LLAAFVGTLFCRNRNRFEPRYLLFKSFTRDRTSIDYAGIS